MKIVIIGSTGLDSLEANMLDAFKEFENINTELVEWPPKTKLIRVQIISRGIDYLVRNTRIIELISSKLEKKVRSASPDLVIVCTGAARLLSPSLVVKLRGSAKAIFCWYVDASMNLTENLLYSKYDHVYFVDKGLFDYFGPILRSVKTSVMLEGYNLNHHRALSSPKRNNKIAVVGSLYPERILLLEYLANLGFEFEIYGFGLPRSYGDGPLRKFDMKKFLTLGEKSKVFQESRCVLNSFTPAHINAVNCRVFEAMASGALLISQRSDLLEETFINSVDLILYENFDELVAILRNVFKSNYDEDKIRISGLEAVADHSLKNRANRILQDFYEIFHK